MYVENASMSRMAQKLWPVSSGTAGSESSTPSLPPPAMVMLWGLARRTARKIEKYHYFTVVRHPESERAEI